MQAVELRIAYVWDCDNCGRENLARRISIEDGLLVPDVVECWSCSEKFRAKVPKRDS